MFKIILETIKKTTVYITPNFPTLQTRRYKFKLFGIFNIVALYSFFVALVVITLLALTPLKDIIFILENEKLVEQTDRIQELEEKINLLTFELESISSTNKRLKYAMILAGTDSLDSTSAIYDSLRRFNKKKMVNEGSIFASITNLIKSLFNEGDSLTKQFFIRPTTGIVLNKFNADKGHLGIDYAVKEGTPVVASSGGLVIFAGYTAKDGYSLIIKHDNDYMTVYKHCDQLLKNEREYINQGDIVAFSGNTGYNTTGAHLHFEIWKNNKQIDPIEILIN
ncbi:MAG: M23 family metallopeptidase [Bacteroidetes bacterium]|nr:M23 family metallopeptidase [Bacteroidota bacterium]MBU1679375.1 M23 family metallopeptidase [Bacteroidota bacterium]MBU2507627.1 M23 family metallopeptidase [Bacteroidota bacterium]